MIKLKLLNQGEPNMNQPQLKTMEPLAGQDSLQSPQINEIGKALRGMQASLSPVVKRSQNPYFKSKYATLESVWEAVKEPLSSNGLAVTQVPCGHYLVTTLIHSSGQFLRGFYPLGELADDPQKLASKITYARRYSLSGMVGIVFQDEDDDGNSASNRLQLREEPAVKSEKIVSFERPASSIKASEAAEIMEKWLIANSSYKAEQVLDFLAFKGYKFDDDDVNGDPLRLPEDILKEVASKITKLTPAIKKWMKA